MGLHRSRIVAFIAGASPFRQRTSEGWVTRWLAYGGLLLLIVAAGLTAFAAFCFVQVRYRKV